MRLTSPAVADRRNLRNSRIGPLVATWGLCTLLGCGAAVSLDERGESSGAPLTGAGPFGMGTAGSGPGDPFDDGARLDVASLKLDVAPDLPLPPGVCPPDCHLELTRAWVYDGIASAPPVPLDPEDQVAVVVDDDGAVTVAEERSGQLVLARLDPSGQELWTFPLALPCAPCRLVQLDLHPSGNLLLAGYGLDIGGSPAALAARVELGEHLLSWATSTALVAGRGIEPRAGSLVVGEDGRMFQPVLEGSPTDGLERLELLEYDGEDGELLGVTPVTMGGPSSGNAPPPRAAFDANLALVLTHPMWAAEPRISGRVSWLTTAGGPVLATGSRSKPSLQLVTGSDGRAITLGQTVGDGESVLHVDSGTLEDPGQWELLYGLATVTASRPALAVDVFGHTHLVARIARGRPELERGVMLQVLRWSDVGELVWQLALPVALDRVDEPVALALDWDGDLVLGGFVGGARHVELRQPSCTCT
jgi:hypothetical protein